MYWCRTQNKSTPWDVRNPTFSPWTPTTSPDSGMESISEKRSQENMDINIYIYLYIYGLSAAGSFGAFASCLRELRFYLTLLTHCKLLNFLLHVHARKPSLVSKHVKNDKNDKTFSVLDIVPQLWHELRLSLPHGWAERGIGSSKARLPDNWNPFSNGTNGPLLQDQDSLHASWCKHRRRAPSIKRQNRACLIPLHRTNLEWSWTFSTIWRQFWLLHRLTSCIKTIAKVLVKDARELDELEELLTISAETSVF